MKRFLQVLGGLFLGVLVVVGALVGYAAHKGSKLDASSKSYVDQTLPVIAAKWSKDELLKRASPELLQQINANPDQTDLLFGKFSQLGELKSYDGSKGDSFVLVNPMKGKIITANYLARATFEHGDAQISIRLIQHDDQWQYLNFFVNSPQFLK